MLAHATKGKLNFQSKPLVCLFIPGVFLKYCVFKIFLILPVPDAGRSRPTHTHTATTEPIYSGKQSRFSLFADVICIKLYIFFSQKYELCQFLYNSLDIRNKLSHSLSQIQTIYISQKYTFFNLRIDTHKPYFISFRNIRSISINHSQKYIIYHILSLNLPPRNTFSQNSHPNPNNIYQKHKPYFISFRNIRSLYLSISIKNTLLFIYPLISLLEIQIWLISFRNTNYITNHSQKYILLSSFRNNKLHRQSLSEIYDLSYFIPQYSY